jgi:hypothetical protein
VDQARFLSIMFIKQLLAGKILKDDKGKIIDLEAIWRVSGHRLHYLFQDIVYTLYNRPSLEKEII